MLPKIVDLFSGCGGLALGFEKAGFDIAVGVEIIPEANETANYNLCIKKGKKANHLCTDITETDPELLKQYIGEEGCIVIGGPPCQAYSLAGKGKLHSLGESRINTKDARGYLYQDFIRMALGLNAKAVVMENVPEAVSFGELNVPEEVCRLLEENGYRCLWTILNSADYGVPQIRNRIILLAVKKEFEKTIDLPVPTHNQDSEAFFMRKYQSYIKYPHFLKPNFNSRGNKWVTVKDAFSDLPILFPKATENYKQKDINVSMMYSNRIQNAFQKTMRTWSGTSQNEVTGNTFRNTKRDFPIFEKMNQGDTYPEAYEIALKLLKEKATLKDISEKSPEFEELKKEIVPPYDTEQFENKWKKLNDDLPSHTVVAHLCKDTYSHIHPWEPRGITVREAARLQSFPDDFLFNCGTGDAYKQIGNAVPPLMAFYIAKRLYDYFLGLEG